MSEPHEPEFPSPLNPRRTAPVRARQARARTNVSVSPTQRLLRYRAAEAWRSYKMLQEAREYERRLMETIASREAAGLRPDGKTQPLDGLEGRHVKAEQGEQGEAEHQFHVPALSFLTPRRVALAAGLMRRFPVPGWFRCERPPQERAC
ncbi:hypothetical protein J3459_010253 [Metarhizium acridum]|uniref:uncharacterized protein n=1 Tax=Metarhizium acridum TaxID=92637 RepID=UPI001C6AD9FF|nr:hypothetical protein J3459_010253 [Metarhizium acridum]KAG8425185.1 hypothetical protein J3458_001913 [Metarhizium acridum]